MKFIGVTQFFPDHYTAVQLGEYALRGWNIWLVCQEKTRKQS